jgi:hypothetical protein
LVHNALFTLSNSALEPSTRIARCIERYWLAT